MKVVYAPEAERDIRETLDYYEQVQRGLAIKFLAALKSAVQDIKQSPRRWPKLDENVRVYQLPRLPFKVVYTDREQEITIIAIFHHSRNPQDLEKRTEQDP